MRVEHADIQEQGKASARILGYWILRALASPTGFVLPESPNPLDECGPEETE